MELRSSIGKQVLESQATSRWLRQAIQDAMKRDPVDALKDAELLARILKQEWEALKREYER